MFKLQILQLFERVPKNQKSKVAKFWFVQID